MQNHLAVHVKLLRRVKTKTLCVVDAQSHVFIRVPNIAQTFISSGSTHHCNFSVYLEFETVDSTLMITPYPTYFVICWVAV